MDGTLILGGTGFLGAHAAGWALARSRAAGTLARPLGPPVWAVGRDVAGAPRYGTPRDGVEFHSRDLRDPGSATALLEELRPKRVLLATALARPAACEAEPAAAERLNVELPKEVARWCGTRGARLIFVSTDLVFGAEPPPEGGFAEHHEPAPCNLYGDTKARGEREVLLGCPAALVVRLPLLFGDSGGRGLGASDGLLVAVEADQQPPLFVDEFRTPLEVGQAARALIELLGRSDTGLLHLAGPERLSRHELGLQILEEHGLAPEEARGSVRAVRQEEVPVGAPRAADTSLDGSRARARLRSPLDPPRAALRKAFGG